MFAYKDVREVTTVPLSGNLRPTTLIHLPVFNRLKGGYRGTSLINSPPPLDHPRALGKVLLKGSRRGVFLISEVPLHLIFNRLKGGYSVGGQCCERGASAPFSAPLLGQPPANNSHPLADAGKFHQRESALVAPFHCQLRNTKRAWHFIAGQPAPAPHLAHPEGRAALTHMCGLLCSVSAAQSTMTLSSALQLVEWSTRGRQR